MFEGNDEELIELREQIGASRLRRVADACRAAARNAREDDRQLGGRPVNLENQDSLLILADLPVWTFRRDSLWRRRLAGCAEELAEDCDRLGAPVPRSTGDEMMLHLALRRAAAADAGTDVASGSEWFEQVPDGWQDLFEDLFQDHDVLALYEASVEEVEGRIDTVNLGPDEWFELIEPPFDVPPRRSSSRS